MALNAESLQKKISAHIGDVPKTLRTVSIAIEATLPNSDVAVPHRRLGGSVIHMNVPVAVGKLKSTSWFTIPIGSLLFLLYFLGIAQPSVFADSDRNDLAARLAKHQFYRIPGKYMSLSLQNLTESQKQSILKIYPDAYEAQLDKLRHERETKMTAEFMRQGEYILEAETECISTLPDNTEPKVRQEIYRLSAELARMKWSKWTQAKKVLSHDQVCQLEQQIAHSSTAGAPSPRQLDPIKEMGTSILQAEIRSRK